MAFTIHQRRQSKPGHNTSPLSSSTPRHRLSATTAPVGATRSSSARNARRSSVDPRRAPEDKHVTLSKMSTHKQHMPLWVIYALSSGACAAANGVFAKLTTTTLTSQLASNLSKILGLEADNTFVNIALRAIFFGLNLFFNAVMWGLFTAALAKGDSTTRVSIVNVSTNFFVTAMLGWAIFAEKLPLQWWLGAALLACGNVVIGMREAKAKTKTGEVVVEGAGVLEVDGAEVRADDPLLAGRTSGIDGTERPAKGETNMQEDLIELDEATKPAAGSVAEASKRVQNGVEVDDPI